MDSKETVDDVFSRPIKKKSTNPGDRPDYMNEGISETDSKCDDSKDYNQLKENARQELNSFLMKRGIDPKKSNSCEILIRRTKRKSSDGDIGSKNDFSLSVQYRAPDGSLCASKNDILSALMQKASVSSGLSSSSMSRQSVHAAAAKALNEMRTKLPTLIKEITVHRFGKIDARSAFHSANRLYPLGYKCTILFPNQIPKMKASADTHEGSIKVDGKADEQHIAADRTFMCEIRESSGRPEFLITDTHSSVSASAYSEADAWKKVIL